MSKASIEMQLEGLEPDGLADDVTNLFVEWDSGRETWKKRAREVIEYVYATSTRETTNQQNPWSHSTVLPKLTQIHDNLGANYSSALFGNREFFDFEPARPVPDLQTKRNAVINYLRTKHDYNGFQKTMRELLDDWVQTGNCFCYVDYVREMETDQITKEQYVVYEGPKVFRISPFDIVFDPTVAEFSDSPKIFRELITRGELVRRVEDSPQGSEFDEESVEKLLKFREVVGGWKPADTDKYFQMKMDGFTSPSQYFSGNKIELLHFMGDIYDSREKKLHRNHLITVADRRYVLQSRTMDDYQGFGKVFHAGWRHRSENLWAQGPLDNLMGLQYLINHLENARADGFDQILSPDRVHIGAVEIEEDGPVTNYYIDDGNGDVRNLAPDTTILNADNQIQLKEAQMEAYAGAPREAMGIRTPGEKTAFEVQSLQNAASRLFQTKIENFEIELVERVLNCELEVAVRNLNVVDVAKVLDEDFGVQEFMNITRDDLNVKGQLKARGASHFAKRSQRVQELQEFSNILAGDQAMAMHFPAKARAKAWVDALGFDQMNLYQPFGMIEEQQEMAELQQASQDNLDEFLAAGETDVAAQESASGAARALRDL